jgi:hypothetical protein
MIIFQIWDRAELEFPFTQWTRFECLEEKSLKFFVDPAHLRKAYLQRLNEYREELRSGCANWRIDLVPLVTDEPYAQALAKYLTIRKKYG